MGFGGLFKQQDKLTDFSNQMLMASGKAKQDAANAEAGLLRREGELAYRQTQEEKNLLQRQVDIMAGQQEHQYLSSGVLGVGTPAAVVNETRKLGQMALDSLEERGVNLQDLMRARADIVERGGLQDYLSAFGGSEINRQQTRLNQAETRGNFYRGLFSGLATGGLNLASATGLPQKTFGKGLGILRGLF